MMKKILTLVFALTIGAANAQNGPVYQSGYVTPTHIPTWTTNGVIQDSGKGFVCNGASVVGCKPDGVTIVPDNGSITAVGAATDAIDAGGATNVSNGTQCELLGESNSRTVASFGGFAVPITCFGASTGSSDNSTAIGNALAANPHILVPCGTFVTNSFTLPYAGAWLEGQQRSCAEIQWKGGQTSGNFILVGNGTLGASTKISSITLDGNASSQTSTGPVVVVNNIYYPLITDVTVQNCYSTCIFVNDNASDEHYQSGLILTDSAVLNWGIGGSGNAVELGQYIYDVSITNNDFGGGSTPSTGGAAYAAIYDNAGSNYVRIIGNNIDGNGTQIYATSVTFLQIVGNSIHCGTECYDGVDLVSSVGAEITGNHFYAIEHYSVSLADSSEHNIICGNIIDSDSPPSTPAYGIIEDSTSKPNTYCGDLPSDGNTIIGTYSVANYSVNGPSASTGTASIDGCSTGVCTRSTDLSMLVVSGSSVTSSAVTFGASFAVTPYCVATVQDNSGVTASFSSVSTSGFTVAYSTSVSALETAVRCSGRR